jgi:methyl-accepting chemotaxis protein
MLTTILDKLSAAAPAGGGEANGNGRGGGAEPDYPRGQISVSDPEVRKRIRFNQITEEDLGVIKHWKDECESHLDELVDEFYEHILGTPDTAGIIHEHTTVERQRPMIQRYCLTMFEGRIDDQYVQQRRHVGRVHDDIDLDSNWYVAMYELMERELVEAVENTGASAREVRRFSGALSKLMKLDIGLVITALTDSRREKIENVALEVEAQMEAVGRSQAIIEFDMDGHIQWANENFLSVVGYSLDEIEGKHHRIFVEPEHASSAEYREMWDSLRRGEFKTGEFKRIGKDDKEVWIRASYNPVLDRDGEPVKVVKYAMDVTPQKKATLRISRAIDKLSRGDLEIEVSEDLTGEFGEIAEALNEAIGKVRFSLEQVGEAAESLSDGDLTVRVRDGLEGEFGAIAESLNVALRNLDDSFGQVSAASEQVASAADQISSGSQELAQGASEQASTLEEVSSSLQELSSMSSQTSANAEEARGLAEGAREGADSGVEAMSRLSKAIQEIKASSDETAKIVDTIDEIAFQTNLLALNAAVEAARAGDAGKGFAVVAEEVRNLAMRSAEAAKDTAELIESSVKKAESGVNLNAEVQESLTSIQEGVEKVTAVMSEIDAASEQQSEGVEEISTAVQEMNEVTQETAANTEEASSAAEELSGQAAEMRSLVKSFEITGHDSGGMQHGPTPSPSMAPRPAASASNGAGHEDPGGDAARAIPFDEDDEELLREF